MYLLSGILPVVLCPAVCAQRCLDLCRTTGPLDSTRSTRLSKTTSVSPVALCFQQRKDTWRQVWRSLLARSPFHGPLGTRNTSRPGACVAILCYEPLKSNKVTPIGCSPYYSLVWAARRCRTGQRQLQTSALKINCAAPSGGKLPYLQATASMSLRGSSSNFRQPLADHGAPFRFGSVFKCFKRARQPPGRDRVLGMVQVRKRAAVNYAEPGNKIDG